MKIEAQLKYVIGDYAVRIKNGEQKGKVCITGPLFDAIIPMQVLEQIVSILPALQKRLKRLEASK